MSENEAIEAGRAAPELTEREHEEIARALEGLLFASEEPISFAELKRRFPENAPLREILESLSAHYETRGVNLKRIGDAYAFRTSPDVQAYLRDEVHAERKLSRAAIETLAIIAYHQPTTRAEIEEIRGVAVSKGTLDQLLALEWIRLGKRRETPGRPVTFLTTTAFLDNFGLSSAKDLPGIAEERPKLSKNAVVVKKVTGRPGVSRRLPRRIHSKASN